MRTGSLFALALAFPVAAQGVPRYDPNRLDGAVFTEQVHTDVTTQSGLAERHRVVVRLTQFSVAAHRDTLVVTADTVDLRETADGVLRVIDVDAVIGGRWTVTLAADGNAHAIIEPFVRTEIGDVSDLAIALRDFFPSVRNWRRLTDSAGLARYHWFRAQHGDSNSVAAGDVPVRTTFDAKDEGDVAWDPVRGPVAWSRRVETTATSRFAGRTNRAMIDQRIVIRRVR